MAGHGYRAPIALWSSPDSSAPITHFPPGLSAAIAIPTRFGLPLLQSARLVNAVSAFITLGAATYLVAIAVGPAAAIVLGVILLVTPALVADHLDVLSEPLFLACIMLALLAMVRAPERPLAAGMAAALATLVRYAGISVAAAAVVWSALQGGTSRERLRRAAVAAIPALLLQSAWVVHARATAGSQPIRTFAVYLGRMDRTLVQAWATLTHWLVPLPEDTFSVHRVPAGAIALAAIVLLATLVTLGSRALRVADERAAVARRLLGATGILVTAYIAVILASRLVADPNIPFDDRILSPLLLLLEVACVTAAAQWWPRGAMPARIALLAAGAIWAVGSFALTRAAVNWALTYGNDFAGEQWRRSELLDWTRTHARDVPIYSNWPSAITLYLDRPARDLPFADTRVNGRAFADTVRARRAVIVDFDVKNPQFAGGDSLARVPGLVTIAKLADGQVLAAR